MSPTNDPTPIEEQPPTEEPSYAGAVAEDEAIVAVERGAEKRRKLLLGAAIVGGVLVLGFGIRYVIWASSHEETDDAYLTAHVHPISARISDTVEQVLIDDNEQVKAGQTLVVLDPRDFKVQLEAAQATLLSAEKDLDRAEASVQSNRQTAAGSTTQAAGSVHEAQAAVVASQATVRSSEAAITRAEAELAQAEAVLHRSELDVHRYEDLEAKGQVSRQTLDHAQADYRVAQAGRDAAVQAVKQSHEQLQESQQSVARSQALLMKARGDVQAAGGVTLDTKVRQEQAETAKAAIERATAELANAQLQLSYTVIQAPTSGRIGRKSVEAGQRVQIGQPLLAVVEEKPWIVANYKETQLKKMRPGQSVEIEIDSFPSHHFHGHVDSLAPGSGNEFALLPPDNATGNFTKIVQRIPVKILLDDDSCRGYEHLLAPGMSAVVTVETR